MAQKQRTRACVVFSTLLRISLAMRNYSPASGVGKNNDICRLSFITRDQTSSSTTQGSCLACEWSRSVCSDFLSLSQVLSLSLSLSLRTCKTDLQDTHLKCFSHVLQPVILYSQALSRQCINSQTDGCWHLQAGTQYSNLPTPSPLYSIWDTCTLTR